VPQRFKSSTPHQLITIPKNETKHNMAHFLATAGLLFSAALPHAAAGPIDLDKRNLNAKINSESGVRRRAGLV